MALARPEQQRILEGDTLRGIERDVRDLVLSLRSLTALLKSDAAGEDPEEGVLARILDAELNQLVILVGDVTTALRVEERGIQAKPIDLMQVVHQAAKRSAVRVILRLGEAIPIAGDPEVLSQVVQSALAIAVRMAEGNVTARVEPSSGGGGTVVIIAGGTAQPARRRDARLHVLRRLISMLGGRFTMEQEDAKLTMKLAFPAAERVRRIG